MAGLTEQRVKEVIVIKHVICLINNLVDGITDLEASCPLDDETSSALDQYKTTPVSADSKDNCDLVDVTPYPGSAGWEAEYDLPTGLSLAQVIGCDSR